MSCVLGYREEIKIKDSLTSGRLDLTNLYPNLNRIKMICSKLEQCEPVTKLGFSRITSIDATDSGRDFDKIQELCRMLKKGTCPSLVSLNIGVNYMGIKGIKTLTEALLTRSSIENKTCSHITSLDLRGNNLNYEGMDIFSKVLQSTSFSGLTSLDLSQLFRLFSG
jgi:Ran GTPase-activating protein (RanGAP) involved in mRNA processing and transport